MKTGRVILTLTLFLLICFVEPLWAADSSGQEDSEFYSINETMKPQEMRGLPAGMSTAGPEKAEGMETTDLPSADRSMIPQDEQELPAGMSTSPSSNQPIGSEMSENVRDKDGNLNDSTIK